MKNEYNATGLTTPHDQVAASEKQTVTIDVEKYQAYLDGADMTQTQKEEYLEALWSIIINFVELGFGVHPLQEVCGQDHQTESLTAKAAFNRLGSEEFADNHFSLKNDLLIGLEAE